MDLFPPSSSRRDVSAVSFLSANANAIAARCGVAPRVTRFPCPFSRFFNARNRQCEHKLLRTTVGKQFQDADEKSSHDPLEIISAASRATPFADRFSRWLSPIFFLVILFFFSGSFFFLFLRQFYVANRPRSYLSPLLVPPTPPPWSAFYGPRTGPIFLPRQRPLPPPPPLLKQLSAVLFLIYMFVFAVRFHLRSFAAPLCLSLSLS